MSLIMKEIVLATDEEVVSLGIKTLFEKEQDFEIVGEADNATNAVRLIKKLLPDIVILDYTLADADMLEIIPVCKKKSPKTRTIVFSDNEDYDCVAGVFKSGAEGYVLKQSAAKCLKKAVREVAAGRRYISPPLAEYAVSRHLKTSNLSLLNGKSDPLDAYNRLTIREREIFRLTGRGLSSSGIAKLLGISPRTVEVHRANIMEKLGLCNRAELIRNYLMHESYDSQLILNNPVSN